VALGKGNFETLPGEAGGSKGRSDDGRHASNSMLLHGRHGGMRLTTIEGKSTAVLVQPAAR